jgi:polysaccharide deacetylase family protein (PEP-CTERM system associated)
VTCRLANAVDVTYGNLRRSMDAADDRRTLLVSVDFEDWHQLVRRRVGAANWPQAGPALGGQVRSLLALLDELGVQATFFVLGMAARSHPELLEQIATGGHEIACHGDEHLPVHSQSRQEFEADLRRAVATIEQVTGTRPLGYRAPAFSIDDRCPWAHEVLAAEGFGYDASEHDSPRLRAAGASAGRSPYRLPLPEGELWELPVAVWHTHGRRVPVGGPSYWATIPIPLVLHGLREVGPMAGLYMHPYEFDPVSLDPLLPPGTPTAQRLSAALRALQRNIARRRAPLVLRAIAERHRLIPYGEAHAQLSRGTPAGP